jgi:pectate lyase
MIIGDWISGLKNFTAVLNYFIAVSLLECCTGTRPVIPERSGKIVYVNTVEQIQQAVLTANPEETIIIADGMYSLQKSLLIENKTHLTVRGASDDPSKVVLKGGGWKGGSPTDLVVIRSSGDITIAYLTITEARSYGIKVEAISDEPHPTNINILRCNFLNIGTRAIKGTAPKDQKPLVGGSVRLCRFENTKIPDTSWLYRGDYISAIDMMYLNNWTFSDNVFKNIRGANGGGRGAIFIWNQSRNIVVERNIFVGCDRSIAFGNPSEPTNYQPGTLHVYNGIICNNFITTDIVGGKGIEVVWADNVKVCFNTIYTPDLEYRAIHYFQKISGLFVANNLVRGRIFGEGDALLEGNIIGEQSGYFNDPSSGDLHLNLHAREALGKGVKLSVVMDDIDGHKRRKLTNVGADQR